MSAILVAQADDGSMFRIDFEPLLTDRGIPLAVMGILVVFAALILVSLFVSWLPRFVAVVDRYFPESTETVAAVSQAPLSDELSEEILVVIAAAVSEVIDGPHRIIHTRQLSPEDLAWSLEGRSQHHTSHRPRNR